MSSLRLCFSRNLLVLSIGFAIANLTTPANAIGFQPVSPDELKMTSEPKAPGAMAITLFREVDRDDSARTAHEDAYLRIKVLTEEGRKYADVEIPFLKGQNDVANVHARTIEPDGSIVNFSGQVFEKEIVKARGVKYLAKTFTMPNVQAGSILEYYYSLDMDDQYVGYTSHWIISDELYTKHAKFTLKEYQGDNPPLYLRWTWVNLPPGTGQPQVSPNHIITLDVDDVPAFQTEDYMPPENELKARVDFIYSEDAFEKDPETYWKKRGKKLNGLLENFIGKRSAMEQAVSQIVSASDSPEEKLKKIYARVQQLRNISYEAEKTEQEQKREKEKTANNVEDVWKKQAGYGGQLTWLFLALVRAAQFDASGVWVADRQNYFFNPGNMDGRRLDENVVSVKVNGKDEFFDPGSAYIPYGLLPWSETAVTGRKLDKDGGSWIQTELPKSAESAVQRKAELKVDEATGDVEGTLTLTFTGLEAADRRVQERLADDAQKKKSLEDEVKDSIPAACEVELTNQPDWKSSSPSMVAEFHVKIPGWIAGAGRRALVTLGVFSATEKHLFDHTDRVHPIYFSFPFRIDDEVNIDLPLGWQIASVPSPQNQDAHVVGYTLQAENNKGSLHIKRSLYVDFLLLDQKYYPALRNFFHVVRSSDEQQAMLQPATAHASR
ncbi:MAG TPA: DUF3857 domain-containing protein [Verrucomicrobiae bacterium]|nr:DUF3857 domain-containing protein [Verrucomicrobiae bacterium]